MKTLVNKMKFFLLIFFVVFGCNFLFAQDEAVEFFIIDSFVTPEKPHTFKLNLFTSYDVKLDVKINNEYTFPVSEEFLEDHEGEFNFSEYKFTQKTIPYYLIATDKNGKKFFSEEYEIILPYEEFIETKSGSEPISTILGGMLLYLLPAPNLVLHEGSSYFSLTKEIPIITFYSSGYNYPSANISLEYSHIYNSEVSDILRLGYKQIFPLPVFEYLGFGVTGFTDFDGFNGVGAEASVGLFKIYNVFTVYGRYRFNAKPKDFNQNFQEISIGLTSHFFTIDF